jgi:AraC-like DNA-binding protein
MARGFQDMALDCTPDADPLAAALAHKAHIGAPGAAQRRLLAAGEGWRVVEVLCTCGPSDRPFEERHDVASISLVLGGTFVCRSPFGSSLLSPGSLFLGNAGQTFECSHDHGEGDRCLSFQFDADLFEPLAHDAGASRAAFNQHRLPPLRALAGLTARARAALASPERFEEIALDLAGAVIEVAGHARGAASAAAQHHARIARMLRQLAPRIAEPLTICELARTANLSPYHFLRTFKCVTGVTPHQWLLRARLGEAAQRLVTSRQPVTDIALNVGFEDLSNFINSFRAEFGMSPRRYRAAA